MKKSVVIGNISVLLTQSFTEKQFIEKYKGKLQKFDIKKAYNIFSSKKKEYEDSLKKKEEAPQTPSGNK